MPVSIEKLNKILPSKSKEELHLLLQSHWLDIEGLVHGAEREKLFDYSVVFNNADIDFQRSMMFTDMSRYMTDDILVKVDRAAMYNNLETRVPLLNHELVSFCWRLPLKMKIRNGTSKWVRELLTRYLPNHF